MNRKTGMLTVPRSRSRSLSLEALFSSCLSLLVDSLSLYMCLFSHTCVCVCVCVCVCCGLCSVLCALPFTSGGNGNAGWQASSQMIEGAEARLDQPLAQRLKVDQRTFDPVPPALLRSYVSYARQYVKPKSVLCESACVIVCCSWDL
jgi:hypothetical protein